MLVITRREAEEIVIGDPKDPIGVVRIASIKGIESVWLGIPRDVPVHRRSGQDIVDRGDRQEPGDTDIAGRIG